MIFVYMLPQRTVLADTHENICHSDWSGGVSLFCHFESRQGEKSLNYVIRKVCI